MRRWTQKWTMWVWILNDTVCGGGSTLERLVCLLVVNRLLSVMRRCSLPGHVLSVFFKFSKQRYYLLSEYLFRKRREHGDDHYDVR